MATEGLEFLLELNAKLDGAVRMVRELNKVEAQSLRVDQALRKAEKRTSFLGRAMRGAGTALREFGSHLAALGVARIFESAARHSLDMGKSLLMAAAGAEKTSRAFGVVFGAQQGRALEDALDGIAKKTELADDVLKSAGQELGAAGFKPLEVVQGVLAALDVAARTGKGEQAFSGVITALKQMQVLGKVPRGLGELGLGKGAGKEIAADMKAGSTAVEAFSRALQAAQGKPIGSFAEARGTDLDVTLGKLKDLPDQFGQKLAGTAGFEKLKGSALGLLEAFDPDSPRGKRIFTALETMMSRIASVIGKIDVDKVAGTLTDLFTNLPPLIEGTTKAILALTNALFSNPAVRVETSGPNKGKEIDRAFLDFQNHPLSTKQKKDSADAFDWLNSTWLGRFMQRTGGGAQAAGKNITEGLARGQLAGLPEVERASSAVAKVPEAVTRQETKTRSPSLVFAGIGAELTAGLALGIERGLPDLSAVAAAAFTAPSDIAGSVMAGAMVPAMAMGATSAAGGAGGGRHLEVHINVNIGSVDGDEDGARRAAELTGQASRAAIVEAFEQWAAEGGGA